MKYRIVKNGLWGTRALEREQFDGSRGIFSQIEDNHVYEYSNITREDIERVVTEVFNEPQVNRGERLINMHISNGAIPRYVAGIDLITEDTPVFTQRVGTTNARNINYMRLQRGDITPMEYLDIISEEE